MVTDWDKLSQQQHVARHLHSLNIQSTLPAILLIEGRSSIYRGSLREHLVKKTKLQNQTQQQHLFCYLLISEVFLFPLVFFFRFCFLPLTFPHFSLPTVLAVVLYPLDMDLSKP